MFMFHRLISFLWILTRFSLMIFRPMSPGHLSCIICQKIARIPSSTADSTNKPLTLWSGKEKSSGISRISRRDRTSNFICVHRKKRIMNFKYDFSDQTATGNLNGAIHHAKNTRPDD
jgi:hypothetical protein